MWLGWVPLRTGPLPGPSARPLAGVLSSQPGFPHSVVASKGVDFFTWKLGTGGRGCPTLPLMT